MACSSSWLLKGTIFSLIICAVINVIESILLWFALDLINTQLKSR